MDTLKNIKKIIIIAGPARSGTSILGKILGSCKKTEYWYEPDIINYIFNIYGKISKDIWKKLFERYLLGNLLNILTGRSINLRNGENSSIRSFKLNSNIREKHNLKLSATKLQKYLKKNKINFVIKSPSIELSNYSNENSKIKIVNTKRNHFEVINSIIKKKWFRKKNYLNLFSPAKKINSKMYPFWMKKKYVKFWTRANETTRGAIYLLCSYEELAKTKNLINLRYDNLIKNPSKSIKILLKKLGLKPTNKTTQILSNIKIPKSKLYFDEKKIISNIDPKILKKLQKFNFN